jgi:serine/threonine protein kinase
VFGHDACVRGGARGSAAEGQVLARLDGRAAPRLVDAGEDERGPWLVMEWLDGALLGEHGGAFDPECTIFAAEQLFAAVAQVHARGIVHADLSPSNVMLGPLRAKLVDFGLAHWEGSPPLPQGPFRGTLLYAAPELARGEAIDARTDVFAAAASLLHVYSGRAPRGHTAEAAMLLSAGSEPIEAWAENASVGLPGAVRRLLCACCAFERADRPSTRTLTVSLRALLSNSL